MDFPIWWLIFTPLLFVPIIYTLRRREIGIWLAIVVCLGSGLLMLQLPRSQPFQMLGRPLTLDQVWAYTIALLFVGTACLYFLSLNISQGWSFYPLGLIVLTLFNLALANRHLGIIALVVEMAVLASVFIIQGGRFGSVRAALRFLVMMSLAVPLFLLAAWQIDLYRVNDNNPIFLSQVAVLITGGFGLWLGVAPLHGWLSAIALEAKLGISAFIFITFPSVVSVILLHLLTDSPQILELPQTQNVMIGLGVLSLVVSGVFASTQTAFGPLLGYTTLFDIGCNIIALGLNQQLGFTLLLLGILIRVIALLLIAISSATLLLPVEADSFDLIRGQGRYQPIPTVGFIVGGLTLAGVPFTIGFVSRWLLLEAVAGVDARWPVIILVSSLGVVLGYLRGLNILLKEPPLTTAPTPRWGLNLLISGLIILSIGIGLFPQRVLQIVNALSQSLNIPIS